MRSTSSLAAALLLSILSGWLTGPASAQSAHTHQHSFGDAEKWAQVFDDPKRDAWQKPHEVIQALALTPGAVIADIGSGTGYFAERAKREGLKNIIAVAGKPNDPRLPEKADLIILVDVYHHIEDRERYFRQLQNSLKPGGRVAIIDFRMDAPEGPPKSARIAPDQVKSELTSAGYSLVQAHAFLPRQYFLIFQSVRP
jgi:predicted methyltransferase